MYPTSRVLIENSQVENRPLDVSIEYGLGSEEQLLSISSLPPPLRGWIRDPRSFFLGEPDIVGYQASGPRAPLRGLPTGPPLTSSQSFYAPHRRDINFNPNEAGVGRTDHQIGPLEVAVTTGSTTSVVSTVSYHLISFSSDTVSR